VSPDPAAAEQDLLASSRAALARQPAYLFFLLLMGSQLTVAAMVQLANLPVGLAWSELFLFAAPPLLWCLASSFQASIFQLNAPPWRLVALGTAIGAANFLFAGALAAIPRALLPEELTRLFDASRLFQDTSRLEMGLLAAALGLVAPVCEEIAFRGYLQSVLRARYRDRTAVLVGAVLFAVLHGDPVGMIARVELGALFGLLVLWTGSLWPAIAAHAANNLIGAALLVYTTERPQALSGERGDLAQTVALGLAGALLAGWLLTQARRFKPRPQVPDPLVDHRFDLRRVGRPLLAWLGAGAVTAGLILGLGWTNLKVNVVDASVSVYELQRRLPDDQARRELSARLAKEHRRAREGQLGVEDYRALRKRLADFARSRKGPVTLQEAEAVLGDAR
jgi:membrane protease YdiL (CAAX protease family)